MTWALLRCLVSVSELHSSAMGSTLCDARPGNACRYDRRVKFRIFQEDNSLIQHAEGSENTRRVLPWRDPPAFRAGGV